MDRACSVRQPQAALDPRPRFLSVLLATFGLAEVPVSNKSGQSFDQEAPHCAHVLLVYTAAEGRAGIAHARINSSGFISFHFIYYFYRIVEMNIVLIKLRYC